jgi:hypothetical protein
MIANPDGQIIAVENFIFFGANFASNQQQQIG